MIRDNKKTPPKNKEAQNLEQMLGCAPGKMKGGMEIKKTSFHSRKNTKRQLQRHDSWAEI